MLFTPWSPHLNLLGRPRSTRLHRPVYEEPIEAGVLPRFIDIPKAPSTRNPKSETLVTTPGDAEQSTKTSAQDVIPRGSQQASSSSCATTQTSMQIPDSQIPKPARVRSSSSVQLCTFSRSHFRSVEKANTMSKRIQERKTGEEPAVATQKSVCLITTSLNRGNLLLFAWMFQNLRESADGFRTC